MVRSFRRRECRDVRGAASVEYAVILATVVVSAAGGIGLLGRYAGGSFGATASRWQGSGDVGGGGGGGGGSDSGRHEVELFGDSFDDGKTNKKTWELTGSWSEKSKNLSATVKNARTESRALATGTRATDSTVSAVATLDGKAGAGLMIRAEGKKVSGYSFDYDPSGGGQFVLRKWVNGAAIFPPLASAKVPTGMSVAGAHRMEVSASGTQLSAKLDGQTILTARDASYASGAGGVRASGPGKAGFDNFSVKAPRR